MHFSLVSLRPAAKVLDDYCGTRMALFSRQTTKALSARRLFLTRRVKPQHRCLHLQGVVLSFVATPLEDRCTRPFSQKAAFLDREVRRKHFSWSFCHSRYRCRRLVIHGSPEVLCLLGVAFVASEKRRTHNWGKIVADVTVSCFFVSNRGNRALQIHACIFSRGELVLQTQHAG